MESRSINPSAPAWPLTKRGVIVRAIIDLAHTLGCDVVAEGVENQDTLDLLAILGCDRVQDRYISPPLPPDKLIAWLSSASHHLPETAVRDISG